MSAATPGAFCFEVSPMKRLVIALVVIVAAVIVFFVANAAMDDVDGLAGDPWIAVDVELEGRRIPPQELTDMSIQFTKKEVIWTMPTDDGELVAIKGGFQYDSSRNPKLMDLPHPLIRNVTAKAIYEVKGDTLQICLGQARPKEFSSLGKATMLWTFKRR